MVTGGLWCLGALLLHTVAGALAPDFMFSDTRLHGDGSITFVQPRRRVGDEFYRIDRAAAYALCPAIGFGETMEIVTEKPLFGVYRAVIVTGTNQVRGPDSCGEVIRAIRCTPPNGGGVGRAILD